MTDPVLSALVIRRAELVAEAQAADANLRRLLSDIEHMDGAIRVCDPAYHPRKVVLNRATVVEVSRTSMDVLRRSKAPMTLRDVTYAVMAKQGKDQSDAKQVRSMVERVRLALIRQRKGGTLRSSVGPGQLVLWEVAR